jgi:transposase
MRPLGSPTQLEKRRRRAIQLLEKGMNLSAVAQQVGSSVSSVFRWQQAFQKEGEEGLNPRVSPGRPARLSGQEKKRLVSLLLKGPLAFGYGTDLWTTRRVAELIRKFFGIHYHPNHLWRLLTGLGWSCQKPERRARERNEEEIERWKKKRWPVIKKSHRTWSPSGLSR